MLISHPYLNREIPKIFLDKFWRSKFSPLPGGDADKCQKLRFAILSLKHKFLAIKQHIYFFWYENSTLTPRVAFYKDIQSIFISLMQQTFVGQIST